MSERYLADAHLILACAETSESLEHTVSLVARSTSAPILPVRTKSDLVAKSAKSSGQLAGIAVSAETGSGLQDLLDAIDDVLGKEHGEILPDLPILTRARHRQALTVACSEIEQFHERGEEKLPGPCIVHLRTAASGWRADWNVEVEMSSTGCSALFVWEIGSKPKPRRAGDGIDSRALARIATRARERLPPLDHLAPRKYALAPGNVAITFGGVIAQPPRGTASVSRARRDRGQHSEHVTLPAPALGRWRTRVWCTRSTPTRHVRD